MLATTERTHDRSEIEQYLAKDRHLLAHRALRYTRNRADAEDLVQATAERALRRACSYAAGSDPGAWIGRIMHSLFIDGYRRSRRAPERLAGPASPELTAPEPDDAPQRSSEQFTTQDVRAALAHLRGPFRTVFEMAAFSNMSYEEIAVRLSIPQGTVGTRLLRARAQLKEIMLEGPPVASLADARRARRPVAMRARSNKQALVA